MHEYVLSLVVLNLDSNAFLFIVNVCQFKISVSVVTNNRYQYRH